MQIPQKKIKVKAMCLFVHENRVLLQSGASLKVTKPDRPIIAGNFHRVLGGSINFGETTEAAVRREIKEELGSEMEHLALLDVIENIFTYEGETNHEIVFLYKGILADKALYLQEKIHVIEDVYEFDAEWVLIEKILNGEVDLKPKADYAKILFI